MVAAAPHLPSASRSDVCACRSPLCTDAEHAAGICARCVKASALRAKLLCACGAKLAVTTEVFTGWCVPCQSIPTGHREARLAARGREPYLLGSNGSGERSFCIQTKAGGRLGAETLIVVAPGGAIEVDGGEPSPRELAAFEQWLEAYDAERAWDGPRGAQADGAPRADMLEALGLGVCPKCEDPACDCACSRAAKAVRS